MLGKPHPHQLKVMQILEHPKEFRKRRAHSLCCGFVQEDLGLSFGDKDLMVRYHSLHPAKFRFHLPYGVVA